MRPVNDDVICRPDPRRENIARRLRERVGGNSEDFYRDGCRLVEGSVVLDAGSHHLGHCAREIESAVREVLVAVLIPAQDRKAIAAQTRESKTTQLALVKEIVRRLGLEANAPEAELWVQLADPYPSGKVKGLHNVAHREAHRHAPPIDDDLRELWRRFESLLSVLLRELDARFTGYLPKIRELAMRAEPGEQSVTDFNKLPNTLVLRTEFYEKATPGWLAELDEGGFFEERPKPVVDERGTTYLAPAPAVAYLARMLALSEHADRVLEIIERIEIPHEFAERDLLKAGAALAGERRLRYARHLVHFLRSQQSVFLLGVDATDLAVALAEDGATAEASAILEELLAIRPDPRTPATEEDSLIRPRPLGRVDEHDFERTAERGMPALTAAAPELALEVALRLLVTALELGERRALVAENVDLSPLWMPNLEHPSERHGHAHAILLARAARDAALAAVAKNPASLDQVVAALDACKWKLCRRIATDVLDRSDDFAHIRNRLLDPEHVTRDRHLPEFDALAEHHIGDMSEADRREFVRLIEAQVPLTHYAGGAPIDADEATRSNEAWKADLLRKILAQLPQDLRDRYAAMVAAPPAAPPRERVAEAGQVPVLDAAQLAQLPIPQVVAHLWSWRPSDSPFSGPSMETQAAALQQSAIADPARFTAAAMDFRDLDPTYVRAIIDAVRELVEKDRGGEVVWETVLDLAIAATGHGVEADEGMGFGRDPGWGWTHKSIADVLRVALGYRPRRIPYDQRERVLRLIEILAEDKRAPAMSDADERRDALSASINSTRGSAIHAAIEYMTWLADETGMGDERRAMDLVPLIGALLERHVDVTNDPSVAARGALGYQLHRLLWYDEAWTIGHRAQLFPPQPAVAAELTWQAFVAWHHVPPRRALEVLVDEYRAAIDRISAEEGRGHVDVDEALAVQLAHAQIRGWVALDSADGLLAAFFAKAPARVRGRLLEELGQIIKATAENDLKPEHCIRVQELWEPRRAAAADLELNERRHELEAFGWIFVSGRCDQGWMLRELLATLALTGSIEPDSQVMEKLAALAPASPVECVRAVDLLTENPKERWFVQASLEEIQSILRAGLADARSRTGARALISRLYADGQGGGIVQLLDEPGANS